jgi:hypothetical protein
MHITGERDGPPVKVGVAVTDLTTGLYTSNSIMAALLGRAKTGGGQHLDVALSDCQTATLSNIASSVLTTGKPDTGRWGTAHRGSHTSSCKCLTDWICSINRPIQSLPHSRRRHPCRRRQRQTLRHPLRTSWQGRMVHRQPLRHKRCSRQESH